MRMPAPASSLVSVGDSADLPTMTSRVDPEGARRMMEMLVNLYADPRLALVREYVSNAVDATRVAGSTAPVRVTTPTLIDPHLVVTDSGTGMSTAEVEATFLAFAASTKRDSNDLIGGLGVGAKSAWALTESFLVDTVKAGKRTLVRAARDLSHQVLAAGVDSDSPDGTTITVPVEVEGQVQEWASVVRDVASAHADGAVLVDGKAVPSLEGGPTWIGPISCRQLGNEKGVVVVRSGGTLFASVPGVTKLVLETTKLASCVIELPVGSFDHTPSRESVVATGRTKAAITRALRQYKSAYAALDRRLAALAETDIVAAVTLRSETLGGVGTVDHFALGYRVEVPGDIGAWIRISKPGWRDRWDRVGGRCGSDGYGAVHGFEVMTRTVVVTNVPPRRSVRGFARFLDSEQPQATRVIPIRRGQDVVRLPVTGPCGVRTTQTWDVGPETPGVEHYSFAQWCEQLATQTRTVSAGGYFCQLVARDGEKPEPMTLTAAEIGDLGLPVWYTYGDRPRHLADEPASVGVYLGKRKTGPLTRVVPQAIERGDWMERRFIAETAQWTPQEKLAVAFDITEGHSRTAIFHLAAAALGRMPADQDRPEVLTEAALFAGSLTQVSPAQRTVLHALSNCASAQRLIHEAKQRYRALVLAYPLLQHFGKYYANHSAAVYLDYLIHTPPRLPEKTETAAA
ncbi:ATP-binding protein [Mycobacteroides abscessus]|uniref:ATP-binding protein n=1 Tax=Mycobacteroides abscessus TaxID=36809 RepID=UPI0005DC9149|nr:ATP-binding protein [Mycobacteroides abscessus]CPW71878.1 HSP90 family protein [Mycobacteroides abscessus]SKF62143.1 HSP90 family protein [Mycobacteroides abscessus subsp. bolletii]SKH91392.1 HSP90 family protein [Mycobacteroides abscessus subsp. bolletii]